MSMIRETRHVVLFSRNRMNCATCQQRMKALFQQAYITATRVETHVYVLLYTLLQTQNQPTQRLVVLSTDRWAQYSQHSLINLQKYSDLTCYHAKRIDFFKSKLYPVYTNLLFYIQSLHLNVRTQVGPNQSECRIHTGYYRQLPLITNLKYNYNYITGPQMHQRVPANYARPVQDNDVLSCSSTRQTRCR